MTNVVRLFACEADDVELEPLALSDIEASLTHQLEVHGLVGTPAEGCARAAARNPIAAVWLHYQAEKSARVQGDLRRQQLEARIAQLEAERSALRAEGT